MKQHFFAVSTSFFGHKIAEIILLTVWSTGKVIWKYIGNCDTVKSCICGLKLFAVYESFWLISFWFKTFNDCMMNHRDLDVSYGWMHDDWWQSNQWIYLRGKENYEFPMKWKVFAIYVHEF